MADVDLSEDSLMSLSNDSALLCRLIDLVLITVSQGAGFSVAGYLTPSSKPLFFSFSGKRPSASVKTGK